MRFRYKIYDSTTTLTPEGPFTEIFSPWWRGCKFRVKIHLIEFGHDLVMIITFGRNEKFEKNETNHGLTTDLTWPYMTKQITLTTMWDIERMSTILEKYVLINIRLAWRAYTYFSMTTKLLLIQLVHFTNRPSNIYSHVLSHFQRPHFSTRKSIFLLIGRLFRVSMDKLTAMCKDSLQHSIIEIYLLQIV